MLHRFAFPRVSDDGAAHPRSYPAAPLAGAAAQISGARLGARKQGTISAALPPSPSARRHTGQELAWATGIRKLLEGKRQLEEGRLAHELLLAPAGR